MAQFRLWLAMALELATATPMAVAMASWAGFSLGGFSLAGFSWLGFSPAGYSRAGFSWLIAALAGVAAGLVNALAGGGSLISFPVLSALGLPPLIANLTNTVALSPGYLGAVWSQRRDLVGQNQRIRLLVPAACLGGLLGGCLLLISNTRLFDALVPWLILFGSVLLGLQPALRKLLGSSPSSGSSGSSSTSASRAYVPASSFSASTTGSSGPRRVPLPLIGIVGLAAVYGGYFGAGLSVIFLAVLGLLLDDSLTRLNGLKQLLAFATNACAALVLIASGRVNWPLALVVALASIVGGALGGAVAHRVNERALRWLVVSLGVLVGLWFLWR